MTNVNQLPNMNDTSAPRPLNCFLLYRIQKQKDIVAQCPGANHRDISKIIAKWWKEATEEEKRPFREQARLEKSEHAKRYPGYRYAPKKKETRKRAYVRKNNHHVFTSRSEENNRFMEQIYNTSDPVPVPEVCISEEKLSKSQRNPNCSYMSKSKNSSQETVARRWKTCSPPVSEKVAASTLRRSCTVVEQLVYPPCDPTFTQQHIYGSPSMSKVSSQVSSPQLVAPSLDLPADCWSTSYLPSPCSVPNHAEPYAFLSPYSIPTQSPFGSASPANFWSVSPAESASPASLRDCYEVENRHLIETFPVFDLNDFPLYEPAQFIDPMLLYCTNQ
ncbi:hypothetical protein BY458DRAFT_493520 [Sporodiniella umbellata]|nr:hypothetical protein BY458DRAFT_493520 [Sporodiniella umbellata]